MDKSTIYQKWLAQSRKGFLECCVLAALDKSGSSYGLALLQSFERAGLSINEGTLYPLLNRMFKNGWLTSEWVTPSDGGHPRRHYQLSAIGKELLPQMIDTCKNNQKSLDQILEKK